MWANFAASAYTIGIIELSLLGGNDASLNVVNRLAVFIPLFLFSLAGTGMMLAGWWRMTGVPSNSGAGGLITGAAVLAALRALVLFVGMVFMILAAGAKGFDVLKYLLNAVIASYIAEACLWVATFSVIPGMAIVGGEIPSRRLRQRAGLVTFIHQILAILVLGLVALVYLNVSAFLLTPSTDSAPRIEREVDERVPPRPTRDRSERTDRGERPSKVRESDPRLLLMFILLVILGIQAAYTYLHYSLYDVGQQAAARGPDNR